MRVAVLNNGIRVPLFKLVGSKENVGPGVVLDHLKSLEEIVFANGIVAHALKPLANNIRAFFAEDGVPEAKIVNV